MARVFGTDGVRGLANASLTAELALDLSVCAAHVLADRGEFEGHRPLAVVGRDTRISGQFLEAAVVAGLASAGVDVLARIHGGGIAGQAGALRLGVARSLNGIDVDANRAELKKLGLLTRDARAVERKKAGLKKARKASQFSKR